MTLLVFTVGSMGMKGCGVERLELLDLPFPTSPVTTSSSGSEGATDATTAGDGDTNLDGAEGFASSTDEGSTGGTTSPASTTAGSVSDGFMEIEGSSGSSTATGHVAACGNDDVEQGEECDGIDLQGATCESLGHAPGTLSCTGGCELDISDCAPDGMVVVPEGLFEMGSIAETDEQPVRIIDLGTFYIDAMEVSAAAYTDCVDAGVCWEPPMGDGYNYMAAGREDHPINGISWYDAQAYCNWVGKRLPTEAEWEKAARGPAGNTYPWGDAPDSSCQLAVMIEEDIMGCGAGTTLPVGSKPAGASPYGVLDMAGNVWEWVDDWYGDYDAAETDNPTGPMAGTQRVFRGGSWYNHQLYFFRSSYRFENDPGERGFATGIRCAKTPGAS